MSESDEIRKAVGLPIMQILIASAKICAVAHYLQQTGQSELELAVRGFLIALTKAQLQFAMDCPELNPPEVEEELKGILKTLGASPE